MQIDGHFLARILFQQRGDSRLHLAAIEALRKIALHASLAANTRKVAQNFTVEMMTDRVLAHMGLPLKPD